MVAMTTTTTTTLVDLVLGTNLSAVNVSDLVDSEEHVQTDDDEYLFDRADVRATFITLYTVVFLVCFIGNVLVIAAVTMSRRLRSITNFFLANLAVADLCVGVFCVYQNLSIYLVQSWVLGDLVCKLYQFVHNLSYTVSIFILVVVCVERYLAIIHPIACRSILTPLRLKAAVVGVWVLSASLCGSRLYWAQTVTVTLPGAQETICISNRHKYDQRVWDVVCFVLLYALPLSVMAALYARIGRVLWASAQGLGRLAGLGGLGGLGGHQQGQGQANARRGVVKLIVSVVGAFAVCHLPLHARRMWQHWSPWYRGPSAFSAAFTPATFLVAYANSAANPLLYALLSRNFRAALKDVLLAVTPSCLKPGMLRQLRRPAQTSVSSRATAVTNVTELAPCSRSLMARRNQALEEES